MSARRARVALAGIILAGLVLVIAGCASAPAADAPAKKPSNLAPATAPSLPKHPALLGHTVRFSSKDEAAAFLKREDAFTRALSPFDRGFRLKADGPTVDDATYRAHLEGTAQDWSDEARAAYALSLADLDHALNGLSLPLPERVLLVRTDGRDEFGAAYTRGNAIVLPDKGALLPERNRFGLLAHELFHVASRAGGVAFRDELYDLLGFVRLPRPLEAPAALEARRLTNPDAHDYAYAITVETPDGPRRVVPVLSSKLPLPKAHEVPFGHMLEVSLVAVDERGMWATAKGGALVRYAVEDTDYAKRVGVNTSYIVHPDEVLADNFRLLLGRRAGDKALRIANREFLDRLEGALSASAPRTTGTTKAERRGSDTSR